MIFVFFIRKVRMDDKNAPYWFRCLSCTACPDSKYNINTFSLGIPFQIYSLTF